MSFVIIQTDKKGRKYAYRATSVWDPNKHMPISKREYLGRVDDETGEIKPKRGARQMEKQKAVPLEGASDSEFLDAIGTIQTSIRDLSNQVCNLTERVESIENRMGNVICGISSVLNNENKR